MGKGSNTTSSSSTTAADPQAAALYRQLLGQAQGVASTPYQAYTGELTAPINSQQQTGIAGVNSAANYAQPYIQQAAGMVSGAANPLTSQQIQNYQNPYQQQVIDATMAQAAQGNAQQQAQLKGNTISSGALGGNREGVAQANLASQQSTSLNSQLAALNSQNYTQALSTAQQQFQTNPMAAAYSLGNLGVSGQNAALTGAGAQLGAGTVMQQTQQAADTANYGQYAQAQAYPYQQLQWLAGLGTGVGSNLGGTSNGTSTAPQPSPWGQIAGLGLTAASMLSDRNAKQNISHVGKMNDGTPIYRFQYKGSDQWHVGPMAQDLEKSNPESVERGNDGFRYVDLKQATDDSVKGFAAGGGVPATPWGDAQGWIPQMQIASGHLPSVSGGGGGSGGGGAPSMADALKQGEAAIGLGSKLKDTFGIGSMSGGWGATSTGAEGVGSLGGLYAHGGVVRGFAAGGAASYPEADDNMFFSSPRDEAIIRAKRNMRTRFDEDARDRERHPNLSGMNQFLDMSHAERISKEMRGRRGFAVGGAPTDFLSLTNGDPAWADPDIGPGYAMPGPSSQTPFETRGFGDLPQAKVDPAFLESYQRASPDGRNPVIEKAILDNTPESVPLPRARPDIPVMAAGDDNEAMPAPVREASPMAPPMALGPAAANENAAAPRQQAVGESAGMKGFADIGHSVFGLPELTPAVRTGLLAAGLGMLASRASNFGNQIGEGGLAGVGAYQGVKSADAKQALDNRKLEQQAAHLADEAKKAQADLALRTSSQQETARHNKASEGISAQNAERTKFIPAGTAMGDDGIIRPTVLNTGTGQIIDSITGKPLADGTKYDPGKGGSVTDEDAKALATRYVKTGDKSVLTGLGNTGAARQKVNRQIAAVQKELGLTDEELGSRVVEFEGRKAGQRTLGTMEAKMGAAAQEAEGAIKLSRGVIEKLPRTSFLPLNKLMEGYSKNTLNPDQAELYARAQAIVNTYSAVMSRGANVTTDSSRHHAAELLNTAANPETFNRVLDTMLQEIDMAKNSPAKMQEYYRKLYGAKATEGAPAAGGAASTVAPSGAGGFTPPAGAVARQYQGKTYYYDPVTKQPYQGQ